MSKDVTQTQTAHRIYRIDIVVLSVSVVFWLLLPIVDVTSRVAFLVIGWTVIAAHLVSVNIYATMGALSDAHYRRVLLGVPLCFVVALGAIEVWYRAGP